MPVNNDDIEQCLRALGETLPSPAPPAGYYVPTRQAADLLFISGQLPIRDGKLLYCGKVGQDLSIAEGQAAAQLCGLNIVAQVKAHLQSDWQKFAGVVKLGGFVNCQADFSEHANVINAASELMSAFFGESGKHCRFAVGTSSLPLNAAVEIEAIIALQ